jgi:hypothetical protein
MRVPRVKTMTKRLVGKRARHRRDCSAIPYRDVELPLGRCRRFLELKQAGVRSRTDSPDWPGFGLLDELHRLDQPDMARTRNADLASLFGDDAVDKVDLGAPALVHVLAHRPARQIAAGVRIGAAMIAARSRPAPSRRPPQRLARDELAARRLQPVTLPASSTMGWLSIKPVERTFVPGNLFTEPQR